MTNRLELRYSVEWFPGDGDALEPLITPDLRVDDLGMLNRCTLDLRELVASTHRSGEFWIFTCGCGEPGCARIEEPVCVSHSADEVMWQIPRMVRRRAGDSPPRQYAFNRPSYLAAVRDALANAKQLAADLAWEDCIGPHGFGTEALRRLEVGEL